MRILSLVGLLFVVLAAGWVNQATIPATNLLVEYMPSPFLGLDVPKPRLSWTIPSPAGSKGVVQTAYRIWVSDSPTVPSGNIWDSGVVKSANSVLVSYAGQALKSDTSYYWKVIWYDANNNASPFSAVAQFDVALLTPADWNGATWLAGFNQFRTEFVLSSAPSRARAYVSGVGYYELFINGAKVGNNVLDISWTDYGKRVMYTTYDVTSLLKAGKNAVGVMVGNGWWGQGSNGAKQVKFLLTANSGSTVMRVPSVAHSWNATNGPITYDSIYNGETYDARLETPGWTEPNYSGKWSAPSVIANGPGGVLRATAIHPIQVQEEFTPKTMNQPQKDTYVYDFEQNFSGWVKINVKGPKGTIIRLRHAEILDHDGSGMIYTANLRSAKATDYYTLKGDPNGETYHPRFTYHGFRFVELTGFPGTPNLQTLTAQHLFSSVPSVGQINLNNAILDRIQHNIIYGQQSNLMSVPTDCDQRDERLGWMGDAQLAAEEAMHNFDMGSFYSHFVRLINDDEGSDGTVTDTVPYLRYGSRPADPAWGAAYPLIVYWLHEYNGDVGIVAEQYAGVKGWLDYLTARVKESGIGKMFYNYGDWVPPPPAQRCNESLTSAFYYILNLQQLSAMATKLGNTGDAAKYLTLSQQASTEFNAAFLTGANYAQGYQTCQVLPIFLGITPSSAPANQLLNDITSHQTHLTTGILGTKYLPLSLSMIGRTDVALELALQTTYPSWGYMFTQKIEAAATTLWELWDSPNEGPGMNSRNHIMFGSVGAWFYQYLAGIRQAAGTVGYTNLDISPPDANVLLKSVLSTVYATYKTQKGVVAVKWTRSGGEQFQAVYPENDFTLSCGVNGGRIVGLALERNPRSLNSIHSSCYAKLDVFQKLTTLCVGQESCVMPSPYEQFKSSECGLEQYVVKARCSEATTFGLQVTVPVSVQAEVHVSKLGASQVNIVESNTPVWQNGKFQAAPGVKSANPTTTEIVFTVASGTYNFVATPVQGENMHAVASEGADLNLSCGEKSITFINFASYGNPWTYADGFDYGSEHAGCSIHVVEEMCLGRKSCTVPVQGQTFLTQSNTANQLSVSYVCA